MIDSLAALPPHLRERLAAALDTGLLPPSPSATTIRSVLGLQTGSEELAAGLVELEALGVTARAEAAWLRALERMRTRRRFDVVVWGATKPQGIIEVKTRDWKLVHDVKRVCNAIQIAKDIRWGLVAYLYAWGDGEIKEGKDRVSSRVDGIADRAEREVHHRGMHFERYRGRSRVREGGAWTVEVLEIRRRA